MTTKTTISQPPTVYKPTTEQESRYQRLQRFNQLYVYLPLGLMTVAGIGLTIFLFYGAFVPENRETTRAFTSALADLILILVMMPLSLVCGIVPMGMIGLMVYRRNLNQQADGPQYGRIQPLLWRLESLLVTIHRKTAEILPKIAPPLIQLNARLAFIETFLKYVKQIFTRS